MQFNTRTEMGLSFYYVSFDACVSAPEGCTIPLVCFRDAGDTVVISPSVVCVTLNIYT